MENINTIPQSQGIKEGIEKVITHEGIFHADEVFAVGILKDLFPESMELRASGGKIDFVKYIRTRDKSVIAKAKESRNAILADVGTELDELNLRFDHHQIEGAGARENGIEYATAGLIWKYFGKEWIKYMDIYAPRKGDFPGIPRPLNGRLTDEDVDFVWEKMDEQFVQLLDVNDTGQMEKVTGTLSDGTELNLQKFTIPELVRLYQIDTHTGTSLDDRFHKVTDIVRDMSFAMVTKHIDLVGELHDFRIEKCVFSEDGKSAIFEQSFPPYIYQYLVSNREEFKDVEFYATPSHAGKYWIVVAPTVEGGREFRNPNKIPPELRMGNDAKVMNATLGIKSGVAFSHRAGFSATCNSLAAAKAFLEYCTHQKSA